MAQDGSLVIEKGTAPTSFYYIVSGECLVTVGGDEVNRIAAGQFLGMIGVIYESARIADVRAVGDTDVLVLNVDDLSLALDMFPGLYKELQKVAEMRFDHVQSKRKDGASPMNKWGDPNETSVDAGDNGPLAQFLTFLENIAHENKSMGDGTTPHPSRMSSFNSNGTYTAHGRFAAGVQMGSLDDMSKLDSIDESDANTSVASFSAHAHISDDKHEQALSAHLASMEQSGAFGPRLGGKGISIPKKHVSPTYGGSLRVAQFDNVGSLEHARKVGGQQGWGGGGTHLSPMGNQWGETSSESEESGTEGSGDEYDSEAGRTNEEGTSTGSSRSRENSLSAPCSGSPPKDTAVRAGGGVAGVGKEEAKHEAGAHKTGAHVAASAEEQTASQPRPEKEVRETDKKKVRSGNKRPRARKSMFRIRFRKAHDTYTAEELGATPRRLRRLTLSGVYATNLKEHDIQVLHVCHYIYIDISRCHIDMSI